MRRPNIWHRTAWAVLILIFVIGIICEAKASNGWVIATYKPSTSNVSGAIEIGNDPAKQDFQLSPQDLIIIPAVDRSGKLVIDDLVISRDQDNAVLIGNRIFNTLHVIYVGIWDSNGVSNHPFYLSCISLSDIHDGKPNGHCLIRSKFQHMNTANNQSRAMCRGEFLIGEINGGFRNVSQRSGFFDNALCRTYYAPRNPPQNTSESSYNQRAEASDRVPIRISRHETASEMQSDSGDRYDREALFFMKIMVGVIIFAICYALSKLF